jgi:acyl-CoA synthetase (AMP-forming)/AMP-acid ligase II
MPQVDFMQVYGMTELAPTISVPPAALHTGLDADVKTNADTDEDADGTRARGKRGSGRLRSGGLAALGVQVCIVGADGRELPRGQVGEIVVRSPAVMLGYWNKPDETAQALKGGWMHTGDGGRMDGEGFVYVVDRVKDMIITGGENVYSVEVEQAVAQHPAVAACAVIGVPDADWGERVHAVVVDWQKAAARI